MRVFFQNSLREQKAAIVRMAEGMREEDNYSTAYTDYTPEKAIQNSRAILNYNHALCDLITKLSSPTQ